MTPEEHVAKARRAIEEMVHRETSAWNRQDAHALVELCHPDMVWPWPPTARDHDPARWVWGMGRFDRERWTLSWQGLFATHRLIHNRREIGKIVVTDEADGGFAVVDIDTLWRDQEGRDNHWLGRVCKVYTRLADGEWKLIMHTGVLAY
ncbi:MAG: Cif family virulence factor [Myxococcales bacterium]